MFALLLAVAAPATDLTAAVDRHLEAAWAAAGVRPAGRSDDAEFHRRVHLDLVGRIPRPSEVRDFLDDQAADKRARLVDRLLADPRHHAHFARLWRDLLVPPAPTPPPATLPALEEWLRGRVRDNVPLDRTARELLTAAPSPAGGAPGPAAYFQAHELKPELLAASASRLFMGVRLECAQCHNHPFAHWKQDEFWQLAAFFTGLNGSPADPMIAVPEKNRTVSARYPDGTTPPAGTALRVALAEWLTRPGNPYFARAAVNRAWAHLFGYGLVDPADNFDDSNPPSQPAVLEALAAGFVASGYDQRQLLRSLTATRAYQLSSRATDSSHADPGRFARMTGKRLTAEQLFDSLAVAVGDADPLPVAVPTGPTPRTQFLARFASPDRVVEPRASVLQALLLMNGGFVGDATSAAGNTLTAVTAAPFLDDRGRLDALFLAALGRLPDADEAGRLLAHVRAAGAAGYGDVFWALLNSTEFAVNH